MTKIIGLTGQIGSGKTTIAKEFAEHVSADIFHFSTPIKNMVMQLFISAGYSPAYAYSLVHDEGIREKAREILGGKSSRYALQTLGTEWGRELISPTLWSDIAMRHAVTSKNFIIFDDVRFTEEAAAIHNAGGRVIRLIRGKEKSPTHESELQEFDSDFVVHNNKTPFYAVTRILSWMQ